MIKEICPNCHRICAKLCKACAKLCKTCSLQIQPSYRNCIGILASYPMLPYPSIVTTHLHPPHSAPHPKGTSPNPAKSMYMDTVSNDLGWESHTHLNLWNRDHAPVQSLCAKLLCQFFVQRGALHTVQSNK